MGEKVFLNINLSSFDVTSYECKYYAWQFKNDVHDFELIYIYTYTYALCIIILECQVYGVCYHYNVISNVFVWLIFNV